VTARLAHVVVLTFAALALCAPAAAAAVRVGAEGRDMLTGGPGNDVLAGRGGPDDVFGAGGRDVLKGGPGADQLLGGHGPDVLSAGPGDDQVHADDGAADLVGCGAGLDTVFADRGDRVGRDCERDGRAGLRGGALATFDVAGERFRAWTSSARTMSLLATPGRANRANIPVGRLARGAGRAGHNAGYSWHLARGFEMAEMAIEVCDARPSYLERHLGDFLRAGGRYCPWGARLVELRNYSGRPIAPPLDPSEPGGGPPVELPDGAAP
jgi:hypothetical protein